MIDAQVNYFRSACCAYAIDGKDGGRLLSPLRERSDVSWWKPLAKVPSGATFELKEGFLKYRDSNFSSDSNGNLTSTNDLGARYVTIPISLKGYAGDFTILWDGDCASGGTLFNQGSGSTRAAVQFVTNSGGGGYITIANGSTGSTTSVPKEALTLGKRKIVLTVNRTKEEVKVFVDGKQAGTGSIPEDLGALNPEVNSENLLVSLVGGLSHFAFWNRALSAEEVLPL